MTRRNATGSSLFIKPHAAAGLVLLFLVWHAFLVSATHFHRDVRPGPAVATHGLAAGREDGAEQPNLTTGHAQCLLCRLQRNFVCDLEQGIPAGPAPPADALGRRVHTNTPHSSTSFLTPSGRAPPSA